MTTAQARIGLAVWPHLGDTARVERLAGFLERSRLGLVRLGVSWADYHTDDGPHWYGQVIRRLAAVAEIVPCVACTPPSLGLTASTAAPPRDPRWYADFLDSFTGEHGQFFDTVELWNEPNNLNDYDWRLDPDWMRFCNMIGGAAYWLRQLGKTTVLGGSCPTDVPLLEYLRENGVIAQIDVLGVHAFPETWTPHWQGWEAELAPVRRFAASCPNPPRIWITEAGYSTWRQGEARQVEMFADAAAADVERVYWYSFEDLDPALSTQEGFHFDERHYHCGLATFEGRPKLLGRILGDEGLDGARRRAEQYQPRARRTTTRRPIVVTGGAGFIGSNLVQRLASEDQDVVVLDNLSREGAIANLDWLTGEHGRRVGVVIGDVRDPQAVKEVVSGSAAVVHLAAQVAVTTSLEDPVTDFEINARGTLNILEAIRREPVPPLMIFASTNKVYGQLLRPDQVRLRQERYQPKAPELAQGCPETAPLDLHSPYGCSKGCADRYVLDYARIYDLRACVMRMSCIFGRRQFGTEDQGWVAHFGRAALGGQPITIFGDGHQVRDLLSVEDAVEAYLRAIGRIDRVTGRAFNLGGGPSRAVSVMEVVHLLRRRAGLRPPIRHAAWRPGDQHWFVADTTAFERATGWKATIGVDEGFDRLMAWLAELPEPAMAGQAEAVS